MKIPILDLKPQLHSIQAELENAILAVVRSGQYILGKAVQEFEQSAAQYLGVKHAIGVNSGTDALVISLRSLGIGTGDEVITTPFSFFATAESISMVGAKPVFVDISPDTFNINPDLIPAQITPQTKAILPVHLYGQPAPMAKIMAIAAQYQLPVLEDCAQSFGARYMGDCEGCGPSCGAENYMGKMTGAIGRVGAFSFFPTKNLGAYGDGGLIATNDDQIAELARMLRVHGAKQRYQNEMLGYNSRLDTLQAAILQVKLPYLDQWNQQRRRVAQTYNHYLATIPEIVTPKITAGHVFHQYTIRVLEGKRDYLAQALAEAGISTMIYYPVPQHLLPVYRGQYPSQPVSEQLAQEVLSLPIWAELEDSTIAHICQTIAKVFGR
ncbi:MAG: DegT/DnrJ/EryC1/StrS family aminotransferase [Pseudanabaenaceae cyanobacterium]